MYCSKCGKEIKDDAAFCPYCGTPVNNTNTNPNNHAQRNQDTQESDQAQEYNNDSFEVRRTKKSHRRLIITIIAVVIVVAIIIAVVATGGHETDSHLKNLAQAGGISPYTFKENVISMYGKGNYNEGSEHNSLLENIIDDLNAELIQSGLEKQGNYNNGVYLLTYSQEIDTTGDNKAEADMITILKSLQGDVKIATDDDWDTFVAQLSGSINGNHGTFFYITGNTMIFSLVGSSSEVNAYELLQMWDSTGEYGIDKVYEKFSNELNDISDEVNELIEQKRHTSNEQIDRGDE